jgi:hypothetical protein
MSEPARQLYDDDFHLWTQRQAAALRRLAAERWNGPLDLEHLAEEVEDLGKAEKRLVRSQLIRTIEHCLKLAYSPVGQPRGAWKKSINEARDEIEETLTRSIRQIVESDLQKLYEKARRQVAIDLEAHGETAALAALPETCPYTLDQLLDDAWYPAPPES